MNAKSNLHTHSVYCDGKDTPRRLVETALEKGFGTLGFSGHSHTAFDESWCMSRENTLLYRSEIARLKEEYSGRIRILCGVEQDYYSDMSPEGYDYVIGSVHYVMARGLFVPVDESAELQLESAEKYFCGDMYAFAAEYFRTVADVVNRTGADIIGHFDLIAKFNEGGRLFDETDPRYLRPAEAAALKLIKTGRPFELNYGAVARGLRSEPYPSAPLRRFIEDNGGRFIVTSDCHDRELLDFGIDREIS